MNLEPIMQIIKTKKTKQTEEDTFFLHLLYKVKLCQEDTIELDVHNLALVK